MRIEQHPQVAVLLATYNGARFVGAQINSLVDNRVSFTLHWLDDHSSDNTREIVRSSARYSGIPLTEWHQPQHVGLPGSFFRLLECVESDIYLFCDQDDIWQPGKIDATVSNLAIDIASPVLCFSNSVLFRDDPTKPSSSLFDAVGKERVSKALRPDPMFDMFTHAVAAHTQGFTRPVREMFLKHKNIAYAYAFMHDWWINDITIASGTVRTFSVSPTVLYRQHGDSFCRSIRDTKQRGIVKRWRITQFWRRTVARHARGFVLASETLPAGANKTRLIELAKLIGTIDQRQTLVSLLRLAHRGAIPLSLTFRSLVVLDSLPLYRCYAA